MSGFEVDGGALKVEEEEEEEDSGFVFVRPEFSEGAMMGHVEVSHKFPGPTAKKPPKPPVVPQQCPYCDHEPVKTASTLRGHVTKAHGLTDSFACPYPPCKFITAQLRYMVRHVDNIHNGSPTKSGEVGTFYCCDCSFSSKSQDELRLHMFEEHPKPGDKTVVFPSQEMDPKQLLATDDMGNPAESNTNLNGEGDDEGNLLIDEGANVVGVGGLVPPELVDIAVALNEDRIIVPPVGKPWQQYQPPPQPLPPTQQMVSMILPSAESQLVFAGETSKRKKPSILRRKSNNAKKPKTEEDGASQEQQQQLLPLRCPMCPAAVMDLAGLEQHLRTAHADEGPSGAAPSKAAPLLQPPFYPVCEVSTDKSCRFCTFSTVGDSAMDHHVRTSHPDTVNLKCTVCKFRTWSSDILKKHNIRHHPGNRPANLLSAPAVMLIPKEETSAVKASLAGAGIKSKARDNPADEVKCPIKGCRFSSSNPVERDHHVKVKHQTRVSYKCAAAGCEYASLDAADMKRHMALEHVLIVKNADGTTSKKIGDNRDPPYPGNPLLQSS